MRSLFLWILLLSPAVAQLPMGGVTGSVGGLATLFPGWTFQQDTFDGMNGSCGSSTTSCTFTVLPYPAGSALMVFAGTNKATQDNVSTVTNSAGDTFTHCPSCAVFIATNPGTLDGAYTLSSAGCASSCTVTVNFASTSGTFIFAYMIAATPPAGTSVLFDTSGHNSSASCSTTCTGVSLTLAGTDFVVEVPSFPGIFTKWNDWSSPFITDQNQNGIALNVASGSMAAPTFAQTPANPQVTAAMAFKPSPNFTSSANNTFYTVRNFTSTQGQACNAGVSSNQCSITIPSTAVGSLLFIAAANNTPATISSVTDTSGDTFTNCVGANIKITATNQQSSCAYTLNVAASRASVTVTMSATATTGFAIYEITRSSGSFLLDAQGSAQRTVSGANFNGVDLTLGGTNDVIFQCNYNPGGSGFGITLYPYMTQSQGLNGDTGGSTFLSDNAACFALLNTTNGTHNVWGTNQNVASSVSAVAFK